MCRVLYRIVSFITRGSPRAAAPPLRMVSAAGAFLLLSMLLVPPRLAAQDTIQTLDELEVSAQRTPSTLQTVTPTQVMDALAIERQGALQLSDAVKQMAGVTLKDYGGVGGVKTVSARGLGSQFSAVTIDGIPVDDSQNGQVDLGRYSLGNAAYVSFSQGQEEASLLSARAYAAGNVLNLETAEPMFWPGEPTKVKLGAEAGSFSLRNLSATWDQRWSKRLKSSLFVNYLGSKGDYPFTIYYTASRQDSTSVERRDHSAVWMLTADGNIFYTPRKGNTLHVKVHYTGGEHQLPGPVIYYTQRKSNENTREQAAFVQARWRAEIGQWKTQVLGKVQGNYDFYEDSASSSRTGYLYNEYRQGVAYLSGSAERQLGKHLLLDLAVDGDAGRLKSNLAARNDVTRTHLNAVAALCYRLKALELRGHLLFADIHDRVIDVDTMPGYSKLTPYASILWKPAEHTHVRFFYKESYRAPNFGELYFFQSIPRNLRPEHARQVNLGATHRQQWGDNSLEGTVDAYCNLVDDKIVARPTHNMYYWSMENLSKVEIIGVDATLNCQLASFSCQLNYNYLHAVDKSNKESKIYGHQIVYTPRHSGGASLRWEHPWVNLGATAMVVGERYSSPQNNEKNRLPAYCDLGISADRQFPLRIGTLGVRLQVLNLLDTQYEVVRSYPMMGRNWRCCISYEF